jgi:acyl carrier protein
MVPSIILVVGSMPLSTSGKVDRRALQSLIVGSHEREGHTAPEGELEEFLAVIWKSLLRVERVSRQDDFFELGADSMTAMRLVTEIAETFSIPFRVQAVFRNPVLHNMALAIEAMQSESQRGTSGDGQVDLEEGVI